MIPRSLTGRLSLAFAVLLLTCSLLTMALQMRTGVRQQQEVAQRLSSGLAAHIAGSAQLMDSTGLRTNAVRALFDNLMAVNPSVEVYLLSVDGRVIEHAAPPGKVLRGQVDLLPVRRLLRGERLPILGDDPRAPAEHKVFDAAPLRVDGRDAGYVYVVLQGEAHDALTASLSSDTTVRTTMTATAIVGLLGLLMGLIAFALITRPLRSLAREVRRLDVDTPPEASLSFESHAATGAVARPSALAPPDVADMRGTEIETLGRAFHQMKDRIAAQWRELARQDQQRRELIANISHDLRTPLTSLHGYLETLRTKDATLDANDRRRYLDTALNQSSKVGRLAQALFELARLESGLVEAEPEHFALRDLLQDVLQKFELAAQSHGQKLVADLPAALPVVLADVGMIERVLTNLLDNAIRHNPPGTQVTIRVQDRDDGIQVEIADTGPGIPAGLRPDLFRRAATLRRRGADIDRPDAALASGGLGLIIVRRLLQLHGSDIELLDVEGTAFRFVLPAT